jgi:hypothetical protein
LVEVEHVLPDAAGQGVHHAVAAELVVAAAAGDPSLQGPP